MDMNDFPMPDWAIGRAGGMYLIGAQLPTRDGRRMGNAHIVDTLVPPEDSVLAGRQQYRILTDAGTELVLTAQELEECFHPPEWVSDVKEVQRKFSRTPWLFTS